jgi:hypothetical protein
MANSKNEVQTDKAETSADAEGQSLVQIRELLFGEQQREHDKGFDQLNNSIKKLDDKLASSKSDLETALQQASDHASRDLTQVEQRSDTSLAAQQKSMVSIHESLDRDIGALREDHNQAMDSLAEQLSLIRDQLENEKQKRSLLAQTLRSLAEGMVDD